MAFREGQRVFVDMGKVTGGKPTRVIGESLTPITMVFAPGADFEGVVRHVSDESIKVELRVEGVKGHVVSATADCLRPKGKH